MDYGVELKQIKQVRHLIADLDTDNQLLDDDQLRTYLELNDWADGYKPGVYRAAADALDAIATSETLTSKKIRTQDLSTDGPAVAAELRKQAAGLRARADEEDAKNDSFFQVLPFNPETTIEGAERGAW